MTDTIIKVAIAVPLHKVFDYLLPKASADVDTAPAQLPQDASDQAQMEHGDVATQKTDSPAAPANDEAQIKPGMRVLVPFGRTRKVGVVVETSQTSSFDVSRLKHITKVLDDKACLPQELLAVLRWASSYYRHPLGEVISGALPKKLRDGDSMDGHVTFYRVTQNTPSDASAQLKRARRQAQLLALLTEREEGMTQAQLAALDFQARTPLRALIDKGWVAQHVEKMPIVSPPREAVQPSSLILNEEQQHAVDMLTRSDSFACTLLHGVTGSGKTEVYFQHIQHILDQGKQCLVLVPEISLTPQLLGRFERRFDTHVAVMHSALTDNERLHNWRASSAGIAKIIIGTRSAVFVPMLNPGLIVIDEEHDGSLKQQEGFRYSARDLAIVRAQRLDIPIVLGTATPSLESLHNVATNRFSLLELTTRAGGATPPTVSLVDLRVEPSYQGLSTFAVEKAKAHLTAGGQVLFFINRRGYAPAWYCNGCGWIADCDNCDAHMTYHHASTSLRCHHCGQRRAPQLECPVCESEVKPVGQGTERVEEYVKQQFPEYTSARMDRDVVRSKQQLEAFLAKVNAGEVSILIGTQMLAKGHHFPNVTLVVILNADQGLFGVDFRSTERLAQTIVQVSGRAGRADKPGEVLIQSSFPEHPLLQTLVNEGYSQFASQALEERQQTQWPPFSYLAMVRVSSNNRQRSMDFLHAAKHYVGKIAEARQIQVMGPVIAPMARRANKHHAQLLCQSTERAGLSELLQALSTFLSETPPVKGVRWSLDVDPQELF